METSYPLDDNFTTNGVNLTEEVKSYLYESAKWGKFISIIGFVFIGFMILGLVLIFAGAGMMSEVVGMGAMGGLGLSFFIVIYAFLIILYFFPSLYLYRFSNKIKIALDANDQISLSEAFKNMKSLLKFIGIVTAVIIGFYLIGILANIMFMI